MKTVLPRNYTLEQLLLADPITAIYAHMENAMNAYELEDPIGAKKSECILKKWREAYEKKPELRIELQKHNFRTPEGLSVHAKLLNIPETEMLGWRDFFIAKMNARVHAVNDETLIRSWRQLKTRARIRDVGASNFPEKFDRPMLVLYSADWCPPCRVMRPTFARLVSFFDKADVRYCHEDEYRRGRGIEFIPQFVAYFPNGSSVSSRVGANTREMWDNMHKLATLGECFVGHGELVCNDEHCEVVEKAQK